MRFQIMSLLVPLVLIVAVPRLLRAHARRESTHRWLLYLACIIYFISWYLPSPQIHGESTGFVTHFIGGGIFSGLLGLYITRSLGLRWRWWQEVVVLYALVSALGVANELFELLLQQTHLSSIKLNDTNWDLLANTLGAAVFYIGYKLYDRRH